MGIIYFLKFEKNFVTNIFSKMSTPTQLTTCDNCKLVEKYGRDFYYFSLDRRKNEQSYV